MNSRKRDEKKPKGFDLNGLMRRVYKEIKNADPRAFAEEVFRCIQPRFYGEVLQAILPRYCSWYSSVERMNVRGTIVGSTKPSKAKMPTSQRVAKPQQQEAINLKYTGWQEAWLRLRVAVESGRKFLGQCNVADLSYMILELEKNAEECVEVARMYKKLRNALIGHKVEKVEDLPVEVQQSFARKAAA